MINDFKIENFTILQLLRFKTSLKYSKLKFFKIKKIANGNFQNFKLDVFKIQYFPFFAI